MYTTDEAKKLVIDHMCKEFGVKQGQGKAISEAFGLSASMVSLMMSKKVPPPLPVLKVLGLKRVVMYVKEPA